MMKLSPGQVFKVCAAILFNTMICAVQAQDRTAEELRHLSIEELMNQDITTASRIPTASAMSPAAVYLITREEIRRSGATTLPDVLRLAPGVQVEQINANRWAVGIRGFGDRLARSMLVLIDGRAVYSPLFAGTYWEIQNVLLEDIERIEVIRGPGGTLWGENAVNGIINIITRNSVDTQGLLVKMGGGGEQHALASIRYGGAAGPNFTYRGYGQFSDRRGVFSTTATDLGDWRMGQGGFRADWNLSAGRSLTLQGDLYHARDEQSGVLQLFEPPFTVPATKDAGLSGGDVLVRWQTPWKAGSEVRLQMYYDRTARNDLSLQEQRNTFDIDFQNAFSPKGRHRLVWGLGYRITGDDTLGASNQEFIPPAQTLNLVTSFAQDEIQLHGERVRLTIGSKFERSYYSGFEAQPAARVVWTPATNHTFVASVSRAVRTPSRVERDYEISTFLNAAGPAFLRLTPNGQFAPEKLLSYELGYRVRPASTLYVTASGFVNRHTDLLSTDVSAPFVENESGSSRVILPLHWNNDLHGVSYGAELTADFRPVTWWRWTGSYSNLTIQLTRDPNTRDLTQEKAGEGNSPRHQLQIRSSLDVTGNIDFDWIFRYVSQLPNLGIPAYATSDVRLAWRPALNIELSIVGRNLHDPSHPEFSKNAEIPRTIYGQIEMRLR